MWNAAALLVIKACDKKEQNPRRYFAISLTPCERILGQKVCRWHPLLTASWLLKCWKWNAICSSRPSAWGGSGRQWRVHRSCTYITIKAAQHGTSCFQRLLLGCIWCISANYGQTAELSAATHMEARLHLISDICSRQKATIMYIISLYIQLSTD